jgi:hypothetical protein
MIIPLSLSMKKVMSKDKRKFNSCQENLNLSLKLKEKEFIKHDRKNERILINVICFKIIYLVNKLLNMYNNLFKGCMLTKQLKREKIKIFQK